MISKAYILEVKHKISLYCDDIILYLTDVESVLHLTQIITQYGSLSGYKVNWEKCELMPLNKTFAIICVWNTKIKWKQTELIYLGLKITSSIYQTRDINLTQTYNKIRANIERWSSLPISLWGQVNIGKMNILPTVNYILRILPTIIQKAWFDDLHKVITAFIWHGKKAQCSYLRMSIPYKKGGLQLPNFFHNYLSFGCQQVNMFLDPGVIKDWKNIEENMLQSLNIDSGCLYYMKTLPTQIAKFD